ncbi:hypothetical protein J132_03514 [Termitomyces sp. J132]|nr:hypothetical protein J132_03514 [Termitomyces sp. J132]
MRHGKKGESGDPSKRPPEVVCAPRPLNKKQKPIDDYLPYVFICVPFGVTYEKIGTIQRRLAWPLHKDDTLSRSGRPTGLNIYFNSRKTRTKLKCTPHVGYYM